MTGQEDTAMIAAQLADLTRSVDEMAGQLKALRDRADNQQQRAETQQERIDLAARELAEVSARLQSAANALRESV
jgi:flagellar hook-basal body complex protein FliE